MVQDIHVSCSMGDHGGSLLQQLGLLYPPHLHTHLLQASRTNCGARGSESVLLVLKLSPLIHRIVALHYKQGGADLTLHFAHNS